ncbi:hypothetical protein C3747_200g2 [Trypanosoma cruzi]|uniref:Uncharacterized protein n=1 Tax=Trypanosoma cruzi TaxID=5693 RepID=A0A2V2W3H6_TRYCR|nr:hypothetical protein C3747_200g2 [Trypanosoma cruzi]
MAKLARLHPPLLAKIWPIARRCVRDDNARVREAIIPLFLFSHALLGNVRSGDASSRVEETATEVVSSLLHLISDRSVAVVTRAITALDTILTDISFRRFLETSARGENLLTFTESKLLAMVASAKENRHQTCVMRLFLHRWVGAGERRRRCPPHTCARCKGTDAPHCNKHGVSVRGTGVTTPCQTSARNVSFDGEA